MEWEPEDETMEGVPKGIEPRRDPEYHPIRVISIWEREASPRSSHEPTQGQFLFTTFAAL